MAYAYSGTFEISAPATITITAPNSGTFYVGDTVNITWSTTGSVGNVKITLYNTANNLIATLASNTANDGSFSWTISGSYITAHETEYQLKIEQVSGGSPYDYSGNLEIYPYFARSADDDISISQGTVGRSETVWKYVRPLDDDIGISQGTVGKDERIWRNVRSAVDSIDFEQAVGKVITGNRSALDAISISQGTVGKVPSLWKYIRSNTDDIAIGQGTVGKVPSVWKHLRTATDSLNIEQSFIFVMTGHRSAIDGIGISQGTVGKVVDVWKHTRSNTDDLVIGQGVTKTPGVWRVNYETTALDDIGIQESFAYSVIGWMNVHVAADKIGMVQEFLHDVTSGTGIKLIYGSTVIDLGNLRKLPLHEPINPKQLVKTSGAGHAKVTDFGAAEKFVNLNVRLDESVSTSVTNFFKNTVQFAKNRFYYQDEEGYRQRVRLWDASGFDVPVESGGQRNISIKMRVE